MATPRSNQAEETIGAHRRKSSVQHNSLRGHPISSTNDEGESSSSPSIPGKGSSEAEQKGQSSRPQGTADPTFIGRALDSQGVSGPKVPGRDSQYQSQDLISRIKIFWRTHISVDIPEVSVRDHLGA